MAAPTIKLPGELDRELTALAKRRRTGRAKVLREALKAFARRNGTAKKQTVSSLAADLIGSLEGPGDLATNPRHMTGFGR
jgi:predicted transcriptional regulator